MQKTLLIIDDDPKYRRSVTSVLRGAGHQILEAGSVAEGINQLNDHPDIRVVILDLSLGDSSGTDFLQQIADKASRYRVIILTAHEEQLAASQATEFAVFRYLPKTAGSLTESLRFAVNQAFVDIERAPHAVKVFVSYTNPDFDKVMWIYRRLKDNGFIPWIDKMDLQPGYAWDKGIDTAIRECDCVLSCLSDIAVKRLSYFQRETQLAVERYDKVGEPFIIPLLFDNCEIPREFADRKIQHIRYDPLHDDWWLKLVATLRSIGFGQN